MKKSFLIVPALALLIASCGPSKLITYNDDVYSNPAEEKRLAKLEAEAQAKKEAEEKKKVEEARLAQKAKDEANPYYKDPSFNSDDYYDYQYASRIRRFDQPLYGAGYYDNYYTNSYWYNQNPMCYGNSIYNSYNWMMPSNQFAYYSNGVSTGWGVGFGNSWNNGYCYNGWGNNYYPYGYNNFGYSPYGYNAYWSGYNNGYYNGWYGYPYGSNGWNNGGWGYYNSYDVNSGYANMSYGVRGSNGGGNSVRSSSGGMAVPAELMGEREKFIKEMKDKQESSPRFTAVPRKTVVDPNLNNATNTSIGQPVRGSSGDNTNNAPGNTPRSNGWNNNGGYNNEVISMPSNNGTSNQGNNNTNSSPVRNGNNRVVGGKEYDDVGNTGSTNKTGNSGWNSGSNSNSGSSGNSSSSPRGSSGGSSSGRPR